MAKAKKKIGGVKKSDGIPMDMKTKKSMMMNKASMTSMMKTGSKRKKY